MELNLHYAMLAEPGVRTIHQRADGRAGALCGAAPLNDIEAGYAAAVLSAGYRTRCLACDGVAVHLGAASRGSWPEAAARPLVAAAIATLDLAGFTPAVHYTELNPGVSGFSVTPIRGEAVVIVQLSRGEITIPGIHGNDAIINGYRRTLRLAGWHLLPSSDWEARATSNPDAVPATY